MHFHEENLTDEERIRIAMLNSYDVIIRGLDPESIIVKSNGVGYFAHNFPEPLVADEVATIIDYFEMTEEYEKCAKLHKVLIKLTDEA